MPKVTKIFLVPAPKYDIIAVNNGLVFAKEDTIMANTINTTYFPQFRNAGTVGKGNSTSTKSADSKNILSQYGADTNVELSNAGLNALSKAQSDSVDAYTGGGVGTDESKLSAKAQSFLENLRKKYGDYDFVVSNDLDTAQTVGGTKEYSVMFTVEELEKMADDDEYAQKVMGQVGNAVDTLKDLSEKDLGDGVQFSQLAVSFDTDGNMKLFAQLEKMSADQKERLDAAREKRAEEQKAADKAQATEDDSLFQADETQGTQILFKSADVEANSAEELLAKIFGIDWNNIAEEETYI